MPIEITGGPFSRDAQLRLTEALVQAGAEPETAALAVLVTPCTVAVDGDEHEAAERLTEAGFEARSVAGPSKVPEAREEAEAPAAFAAPTTARGQNRGLLLVAAGLGIIVMGLLGVIVGRTLDAPAESAAAVTETPPPGAMAHPAEALPELIPEAPSQPGMWRSGTVSIPGETDGIVTLRLVRTGRHDGFDRVVFEFAGDALPGVQISAVDQPEAACGSGDAVAVDGAAWLAVRFQPAQAHTDDGAPTVTDRRQSPRLPTLRELALTCDFEADVSWTLGLSAARPYRTQILRAPLRLVLDVQTAP